jgi:hypothetical protein
MRVSTISLWVLLLWNGGILGDAQSAESLIPGFRLTPEQVAQAAQRVDHAILAQDRARWERDAQAKESWERKQGMRPAPRTPFELPPQVDDATFLRRITLDLLGRNPEAKAMRAFLADKDVAKRGVMVDTLLLHPASSARRYTRLADMLRVKDTVLGASLRPYATWLQNQCVAAAPYDQLVRELITATGEVDTNPATGWLLGDAGDCATSMTEALRIFLDEDISCARCHNHPYEAWTQREFYEFAACLGGAQVLRSGMQGTVRLWPVASANAALQQPLSTGERLLIGDASTTAPVVLPSQYAYRDGKPGEPVRPKLWQWNGDKVDGRQFPARGHPEKLRGEFARWVTGSRRFAEVAALRTWIILFGGRGDAQAHSSEFLAADGLSRSAGNQSSCCAAGVRSLPSSTREAALTEEFRQEYGIRESQVFLTTLAQELVRVRYDLRELERILCHTAAYQRESLTSSLGVMPRTVAPLVRRLPPETVWNNLVLVQSDGVMPSGAPLSHELAQVPDAEHPSRILGRGSREWGDDSIPLITHTLARFMMNGDPVKLASDGDSPLVRRLRATLPVDAAVDEAFLAVLARFPSHDEKMKAMEHGIANPTTVWNDLVWSLLNTSEFLFQR